MRRKRKWRQNSIDHLNDHMLDRPPVFVTAGADELRLDQRQALAALEHQHPEQMEWLKRSLQHKTVLVIRITGYRYTGFETLLLLQCAHAYGVPILLLPCQDIEGREDQVGGAEKRSEDTNEWVEKARVGGTPMSGTATAIRYYRFFYAE